MKLTPTMSTNILPRPVKSGRRARDVGQYQPGSRSGRILHPVLIFCQEQFLNFFLASHDLHYPTQGGRHEPIQVLQYDLGSRVRIILPSLGHECNMLP